MKVIQSIEASYEEQKPLYDLLKERVDNVFANFRKAQWHYVSRVKAVESYALKLETGRFPTPKGLEDFFGCTLVVENLDQIHAATQLVEANFNVRDKRPKDTAFTHKEPSSFQFDDLRIYATLTHPDYLPPDPITDLLFEIQIKTFLQYAWGLATHDMIYKSDEINWSKERIAYQIKAMLEQAELAISGVKELCSLPEVAKDNKHTTTQKQILLFLNEFFSKEEDLPIDVVRLCGNIKELMDALSLTIQDLRTIIQAENEAGRGTNSKNLSPFLLIIQSIINQRSGVIENFINSKKSRFKLFLPKEIQMGTVTIRSRNNIIRDPIIDKT